MTLATKTLSQLVKLLDTGEVTSTQITESYIQNIETKDPDLGAFVTKTFDLARGSAQASDKRRQKKSPLSPLDGIPITLKDVVCTENIRTTASSKMLENFVPPYSATVWKKLEKAGCVLLGKVNTDEFTMGSSTKTSAFGVTKNPHNPSKVAGGSSGGSACAVGSDFCAGSIGTDTGGSIRQPAHFCGVTGLKVSYGRVSRWGVIPMASSLDTVGPLAKTAQDNAYILSQIAGKDPLDATTTDHPVPDYLKFIEKPLQNMKIGIPREYFEEGLSPENEKALEKTKKILKSLGVTLVDVSLPHTKYAVATYYILAPAEISANMARFDGIRFGLPTQEKNLQDIYQTARMQGLGEEVKRRIMTGVHVLSSGYSDKFYLKALQMRTLLIRDFEEAFQKVDALLTPVSPTPAFGIDEPKNTLDMYHEDVFLTPSSLAGVCGISMPMSITDQGLPVGVHFASPAFCEETVLQIAHQIQKKL